MSDELLSEELLQNIRAAGLDPFSMTRSTVKRRMDLEKAEKPIPPELDLGVTPECIYCRMDIFPPLKPKQCSQCQAVIFCSVKCSKLLWHHGDPTHPRSVPHKDLCVDNKRHMKRLAETQAILKMFPWGRLEKDGSCCQDAVRAQFDVLGGANYGYWSQRGGLLSHVANPNGPRKKLADQVYKMGVSSDFIDGFDLLRPRHLTDEEGWMLAPRLIPYLDFSHPSAKQPLLVTELPERIRDWRSWYSWRRLPLESPAAMLMSESLSVYQLLVQCLEITQPHAGSPQTRKALLVHMIGAELELNRIPLLGELALLLPYHDIKLVLFGGSVFNLVKRARGSPGAVASGDPVYTYTAPDACGSGHLSVHFFTEGEFWTPDILSNGIPDAIVACNAGLVSYPQWGPVVMAAHHLNIPMAVTEYAEQSVEHQMRELSRVLPLSPMPPAPQEYSYALNPFQRPGQRPMPSHRMPNVHNGFTFTVVKK